MTRGQVIGFVVLCLWSSAAWFTADLLPGRLGAMEGQGLRFLLIGLLAYCSRSSGGEKARGDR